MRKCLLLILGISLTGCASHQDKVPAQSKPVYDPAVASALVFDPPVAYGVPMPSFSREGRSPSAFYGYEQSTVDSYYLYQRDQVRGDEFPSRFDRTAHTSRSSVTYR